MPVLTPVPVVAPMPMPMPVPLPALSPVLMAVPMPVNLPASTADAMRAMPTAPDAMRALVDALPPESCWRDGSAEDARRSRHPWPWWAE